jgi:hypothetical protein
MSSGKRKLAEVNALAALVMAAAFIGLLILLGGGLLLMFHRRF